MKAKTLDDFKRGQDPKKSLGVGIFRDVKIENLSLPVKYEYGTIVDAKGYTIIRAERGTLTPLQPYERDDLLKIIAQLINYAL